MYSKQYHLQVQLPILTISNCSDNFKESYNNNNGKNVSLVPSLKVTLFYDTLKVKALLVYIVMRQCCDLIL